ncbi:Holliday junction resolvase RuvX [Candidatus Similichlamydia epinepheli]|uniref:Holliday junction resolvase RuvX n=1 Tax=Candidatus Similichlamydia epinepheli TaxID=1903953 RepID=UPI0013008932|nr:Holliday junction resolvase RuvX [Candidatus Similichlamydia epinepheli]
MNEENSCSKKFDKRSVAVDPGMARCGLAISDPSASFSLPLQTIILKKKDPSSAAIQILQTLKERLIEVIVVGIPLLLSGRDSRMTAWARELYQHLSELLIKTSTKVVAWDERLSSRHADVLLNESKTKKKHRKEAQDSLAAAIILQSYLDTVRNQKENFPEGA